MIKYMGTDIIRWKFSYYMIEYMVNNMIELKYMIPAKIYGNWHNYMKTCLLYDRMHDKRYDWIETYIIQDKTYDKRYGWIETCIYVIECVVNDKIEPKLL